MKQLISKSFASQAIAFPDRVDQVLAEVQTLDQAKGVLDQAVTMQKYADQLRAGVDIERPIAIGVLKIKAKLGELMPSESKGGRGKQTVKQLNGFSRPTISAYRKLADNKDRLEDYYESIDDVPSQGDFIKWCSGPHVSNNSGNNEWYTPAKYIESARSALGAIDLDPASNEVAQGTVAAREFYTAETDGLSQDWRGRVFLNPPYERGLVDSFVTKLVAEFDAGNVTAAVLLVNNATEVEWFQKGAASCTAICFPAGRIKYNTPEGTEKGSPLQGQAVFYFGDDIPAFEQEFSEHGIVLLRPWDGDED